MGMLRRNVTRPLETSGGKTIWSVGELEQVFLSRRCQAMQQRRYMDGY